MEKIIFLDIDGVIATPETIIRGAWGLTPECQKKLGKIIEKTNAKIVVSSSWRLKNTEETLVYFKEK